MNATAIYGLGEFMKTIEYVRTIGNITERYIGMAMYYNEGNPNKEYKSNADKAKPIFRIKKIVETEVSGTVNTTETFFPVDSNGRPDTGFNFIWDDGSQNFLNYVYL